MSLADNLNEINRFLLMGRLTATTSFRRRCNGCTQTSPLKTRNIYADDCVGVLLLGGRQLLKLVKVEGQLMPCLDDFPDYWESDSGLEDYDHERYCQVLCSENLL